MKVIEIDNVNGIDENIEKWEFAIKIQKDGYDIERIGYSAFKDGNVMLTESGICNICCLSGGAAPQ